MWTTLQVTRLSALSGLALLGACSDGTAPSAKRFDEQRVETGVAAVEKVAASSALSSLQLLTRFSGQVGVSTRQIGPAEVSPGLGAAARAIAATAVNAGTFLVPVMRPSVLGKTFVFDPVQRAYVVAPDRTGAPANGVRFVLYEQTSNGEPIVGREIGHADLTDEKRTTPGVASVKLVAVIAGVTRLSYAFDLALPGAAPSMSVKGYAVDGSDRLDFTVTLSSTALVGGKATVLATLVAPQHGFEVSAKMTGVPGQELGDGDIDLTISSASDEIIVDASIVNEKLDATFTVNGALLARATGSPRSPLLTGAGGVALSRDELQALTGIVRMSDAVFRFVGDLVEPAGRLLLLALGVGG